MKVTITYDAKGKGRGFNARMLSCIEAEAVAPFTSKKNTARPVFAVVSASEDELRAWVANVKLGAEVRPSSGGASNTIEFPRTAGYTYVWQKTSAQSIVTIYLRDLFVIDPGAVDPDHIKLVFMPGHGEDDVNNVDARMKSAEHLFAMLERRTRCPMPREPDFKLKLYKEIAPGLRQCREHVHGIAMPTCDARWFSTKHETFEKTLAEVTAAYYAEK